MARPRKVSDSAVLAACERVIGKHGPNFTLAHVAAEAGVAVGTVAGRFGSKHGLLVALMDASTAVLEERMRAVAQEHDDPVAAVRAALLATVVGIDDPETAARHLGQLGVDLADPVLRERFARQRKVVREVLAELLAKASLPGAPAAESAAALLASLAQGVQLDWALEPKGALPELLSDELDPLLRAWGNPVSDGHAHSRRDGR
ncbi:TetR/AcrR family transcriptional regulator [Saccharomonospora viridis]|jgi:AcrR family transcriptional regulator|uniref:TetR/AcrR family transcriptional regulator n=1 Tax=Saccharomonospora viridis TaxID=1852 RepID=UPI00068FCFC3|nr:TetR/AcrR family transcriptional regulator [Saccharomonospora viridis]